MRVLRCYCAALVRWRLWVRRGQGEDGQCWGKRLTATCTSDNITMYECLKGQYTRIHTYIDILMSKKECYACCLICKYVELIRDSDCVCVCTLCTCTHIHMQYIQTYWASALMSPFQGKSSGTVLSSTHILYSILIQ